MSDCLRRRSKPACAKRWNGLRALRDAGRARYERFDVMSADDEGECFVRRAAARSARHSAPVDLAIRSVDSCCGGWACGTDVHIFAGHANYNTNEYGQAIPLALQPQILGHEITGVVEEVGSAVNDLREGDRVVVDQGLNCVSRRRESSL